jgi:hypothetical protein
MIDCCILRVESRVVLFLVFVFKCVEVFVQNVVVQVFVDSVYSSLLLPFFCFLMRGALVLFIVFFCSVCSWHCPEKK